MLSNLPSPAFVPILCAKPGPSVQNEAKLGTSHMALSSEPSLHVWHLQAQDRSATCPAVPEDTEGFLSFLVITECLNVHDTLVCDPPGWVSGLWGMGQSLGLGVLSLALARGSVFPFPLWFPAPLPPPQSNWWSTKLAWSPVSIMGSWETKTWMDLRPWPSWPWGSLFSTPQ